MGTEGGAARAPHAALGLVRGVAGAVVTVEILNAQGGGATVDAPAVHTVAYAAGDCVLVLLQSDDLDSAVVVGRIGNPEDAGGIPGIYVNEDGDVGIGTEAPQARLHTWDGTGGFLFGSRTAIGTTAQTIIPDGTGDVTRVVRIEAFASNGTATAYGAFTLTQGGTMSQNLLAGSDTYQVRLNADGSLDVRRTAGTNAGTLIVRAMWL